MEKFSVKEKFETKIINIWSDQKYNELEIINRGFAIQDNVIINSIMFIGINPSFNETDTEINQEFYNIEQRGKSYPYFNKFKEISEYLDHHWTHFDLLFFRETNQNYINNILKTDNNIGVDFIFSQLEISKQVLILAKPKVLIVSNTTARYFLGFDKSVSKNEDIWMGFDFVFDEKLGTHKIINNKELENTPVFFTSMLTGQRALDKGSLERLMWHIQFVINQN